MKSSITVICGHYGCGKTNLVLNLAAEASQRVGLFRAAQKTRRGTHRAGVREHNARYPCAAAGDLLHL